MRPGEFTTLEAAYLASACLTEPAKTRAPIAPREVLFRTALGWPSAEAPVTERTVSKAIEEKIVSPSKAARVKVDEGAVLYLVSAKRLEGVRLSREAKARLYGALRRSRGRGRRNWRWKIAPTLYFTPGRELGRWHALVDTYARDRHRHVASDPEILGGTPIIRGTRISVHGVLARLAGGDTMDDLVADYPEVSRAAFEAAVVYARTHPRRGRPARRLR